MNTNQVSKKLSERKCTMRKNFLPAVLSAALVIAVLIGSAIGGYYANAAPVSAAPPVSGPGAPASGPAAGPAAQVPAASLNYDETNADALTPEQTQLIALYLRILAPITQAQLESAVSQIQVEAAASSAVTFQGSTLTLDQNQAWLVWCSDATAVDPPADVSLVHEISLLDVNTLGRVWIQVPFATGVPLRTDDTWTGCNATAGFWAVKVH